MTVGDLVRPISTEAEVDMFFRLQPQFTKGKRTNWQGMAAEWNTRVWLEAAQRSSLTEGVLFLKEAHHLTSFSKTAVSVMRARDTDAASGALTLLPTAALAGDCAEQNVMDALMQRARSQKRTAEQPREQQAEQPLAKRRSSGAAAASGSGNKRGGKPGHIKTCQAAGCKDGGTAQLTMQHKATCAAWGFLHPEAQQKAITNLQKAAKKAQKARARGATTAGEQPGMGQEGGRMRQGEGEATDGVALEGEATDGEGGAIDGGAEGGSMSDYADRDL
jgi:predicted Fe-S protein YdhL (DUF1289 family)